MFWTENYSFNIIIMATLLDSVENSIWHAFDFLALEGDGTATKVKLKVGLFLFDIFYTYRMSKDIN